MSVEAAVVAEIRGLEERLLRPEVRASPSMVAELLADDFLEFGRSGRIFDREQTIKLLREEATPRLSLDHFQARLLAEGVVLATYHLTRLTEGGQRAYSLRSSIWQLRGGRWQLLFHPGTPTQSA